MKKAIGFALLALTGCGPSPEQICGTGLAGAVLYAVVAWLMLLMVQRVSDRITTGAWQELPTTRGFPALVGVYLIVSLLALMLAPQVKDDTAPIILGCAAGNVLFWSLLVRLITRWSPARAVLLGCFISLAPAVGGALAVKPLAAVSIYMWFWGGFFGAVPAGLIVLVWIAAWIRRPPP